VFDVEAALERLPGQGRLGGVAVGCDHHGQTGFAVVASEGSLSTWSGITVP